MGLFDFLKRDKKEEERIAPRRAGEVIQDENNMEYTKDGRKVFEYYEAITKPGQFYDTTKVVIDSLPQIVDGEKLYDLFVSWYGRDDCIYLEEPIGRRFEFEHVIAGIDPELMEKDPHYLSYAIKNLLGQNRVKGYLEKSLMTEEELEKARNAGDKTMYPCGRYIGEITKKEDGSLGKRFNGRIGRMFHNTSEMQCKRDTVRREKEAQRQARIADKKARIARLQAELEEEEK